MNRPAIASPRNQSARPRTGQSLVAMLFLVGWTTYQFALFNVGHISITLLLVVSGVLAILAARSDHLYGFSTLSLVLSTGLAWSVAYIVHGEQEKTVNHLLQCLLTIGVMVGARSIDWKAILPKLQKGLLWIATIILFYGGYQYVARQHKLPLAFLPVTNQQLTITDEDGGLQRGAQLASTSRVLGSRVSSCFAEPSHMAYFMLWVFAVGYGCTKGTMGSLLMTVGVAGVLLSQSMGGFVGLLFLPLVMTVLKMDLQRTAMLAGLGAVVVALLFFGYGAVFDTLGNRASKIVTQRDQYLVKEKRFAFVEENFEIFLEAPYLGHGLASQTKVAAGNTIANAYQAVLIERGLIGAFLYFAPFFWACTRLVRMQSQRDEAADVALMVLLVVVYAFAWRSQLFFTPLYFTLGFAISQVRECKQKVAQRVLTQPAITRRNTVRQGPGRLQPHAWPGVSASSRAS